MASFEIVNDSDLDASFNLSLNGNDLFVSSEDIVAAIKATPAFLEKGFPYAAWEWLAQNTYHFDPYTGDVWQHAPYLYLNSLGFGYCDDVASLFAQLMISQGYEARVWGISGHVVAEVFNNGRWELYDVDLRALYIDTEGNIAGYDYIVGSGDDFGANLASSSYADDVYPVSWAYADSVINLYRSTSDNVISSYYTIPLPGFAGDHAIILPAHASLSIRDLTDEELYSIYDTVIPDVSIMDVQFGALEGFAFEYPLVPISITGQGTVIIDHIVYNIGSAELDQRLASRDDPVYSIIVNTTGFDNQIEYLVNPIRFSLDGSSLDVDLLNLVGDVDILLTGTSGAETLAGHGAGDRINGNGGADTLLGGGGDDVITQTASAVNGAAGTAIDGGLGGDTIKFDGSQAYTTNLVSILGGGGRDTIEVAVRQGQYLGSVRIDGGADNDTISVGHIEGSRGSSYIDGGIGDDVIRVVDTWNGVGIWSNAAFQLRGGEGNDRFELAGTQLNILGNDQGVRLDGGSGFDTLVWNGRYNLGVGGHQNAAVGLYAGRYAQELVVGNVEALDIAASGALGLHVSFSAQEVASITSGSDFDRASLGLGLTGTGNTLFVNAVGNDVSLAGWTDIGAATVGGVEYGIYQNGSAYLGVLVELTLTGTSGAETLAGRGAGDRINGNGGADTLLGGGGDDVITQTASAVNGAAGTAIDGGLGGDTIKFDGSQAYTTNLVSILGGGGRDTIEVAVRQGQYLGSVRIDGGADNDTISVGHIEGSRGSSYIDGGIGDDVIRVVDTWNGVGIWSNAAFQLRGGEGNDRFELAGTQLNILGNDQGVRLDGGSGFDTLVWNGRYNLGVGGHQNVAVGLYAGRYAQELVVGNVEALDIAASGALGLHVSFSAQEVASITSGSDFDRASLGLGLTGTGNTLFVNAVGNDVSLAGWTDIGAATVGGVEYEIYQNGSAYLGVLFAELTLTGTSGAETLAGRGAGDRINGNGGADTLLGGGGDDVITQTASAVNGAAGTAIDGGLGGDTIKFDGSQAYTTNLVSILGGGGRDTIEVAVRQGQYLGSVRIDGGADNDTISVGHIEGSRGSSYIDGGIGDDVIRVVDTWNGVGIWSNAAFQLRGGEGNDRFELAGTQLNILGNDQGVRLDGGSGFDTLVWNGRYNLGVGGHQNAAVGLYAGRYAQELVVGNVEALDIAASGALGLHVSFSAQEVASITSGSDFDRASLGLGLTGTGNTLFVNAVGNDVSLAGWTDIGAATVGGVEYEIYQNGSAYLGVLFAELTLTGTSGAETLAGRGAGDRINGNGGADTLLGGGGDDVITQTASAVNGAAGTAIDGGLGGDTIKFDGSQAYTTNLVSILGGGGRDTIEVAVRQGQYLGSVRIDGGADNDTISVGHIEGSRGSSYIDGGIGDDVIRVVDTWNGVGIWSNAAFQLRGGEGNDRFELAGTQLNILGNDQGVRLDGGSGFDTLVWNGRYNLGVGGHQNAAVGLYAGRYAQELVVGNVEALDIAASGALGLHVSFSAQEVASITSGSDFDRASLGLGLTGTGNTLFVNAVGNDVSLAGWTDIGAATVGGVEYEIYQNGSAYLGVLFAELTLTGTSGAETLAGRGAGDRINGNGGADTLLGGGGDDVITQTASAVNGAAGTAIDGGLGGDTIKFDGSQAYTTNLVSILGGGGRDTIEVAVRQGQYLGSVRIDGGADNDTISVGHIEGSRGSSYIDGGIGDDVIRVVDTWNGVGIWSNAAFQLRGGEGNDRFELAGTQLNILGNDQGVRLDGGSGFDTLVWNGRYNLGVGGHQNAAVGLYAGRYAQELVVGNVEALDIAASGALGLHVSFSAQEVASITSGSDFDRASLGLGLTGTGNTLFVNAVGNDVSLAGWTDIGAATVGGVEYEIYRSGASLLAINNDSFLV